MTQEKPEGEAEESRASSEALFAGGASPRAAAPRPEQIGRYRIVGELGGGGMGVVYRAIQEHPAREVALKLVRADVMTPEAAKRFEREGELAGRLQHPGIAQVFEAGVAATPTGPQPFLAMELIEGVPLVKHADDAGLPLRARVELLRKVADAVAHAHSRGVVHRDLKPGNVLVDRSGAPKVVDFGLARALERGVDPTTTLTTSGQLLGTLRYMSPEQADPGGEPADARSDVYALGIVGYELLAGRMPYVVDGKSLAVQLETIRGTEATPAGKLDRALAGDLETILLKALEKERARRYADAGAMAADLDRFLRDEPIEARRASGWYRAAKFTRRHKALVGGVAATIVVLLAGIASTTWWFLEARSEGKAKTAEAVKAQREAARAKRGEAQLAGRQGQWERAIGLYEEALAGAPPDALDALDVCIELVEARVAYGQDAQAAAEIAALVRADALGSRRAKVRLLDAESRLRRNEAPAAPRAELERLAEEPDLSEVDRCYVRALITPSLDEARVQLDRAVALDPFHYGAQVARLGVLLALGDMRELATSVLFVERCFPQDSTPLVAHVVMDLLRADRSGVSGKLDELGHRVSGERLGSVRSQVDLIDGAMRSFRLDDIVGNGAPPLLLILGPLVTRLATPSAALNHGNLGISIGYLRSFETSWARLLEALNPAAVLSGELGTKLRNALAQAKQGNSVALFHFMHGYLTVFEMKLDATSAEKLRVMESAERSFRRAAELPAHHEIFTGAAAYFAAYAENLLLRRGVGSAEEMRANFRRHVAQLAELPASVGVGVPTWSLVMGLASQIGEHELAAMVAERWLANLGDSAARRLALARLDFARGAASEAVERLCALLEDDPANAEARALLDQAKDEVGKVGTPGQSLLLDDYLDEHLVELPATAPPSGGG